MPDNGQAYQAEYLRAFCRNMLRAVDDYRNMLVCAITENPGIDAACVEMEQRTETARLHAPPALAAIARARPAGSGPVRFGDFQGPSAFMVALEAMDKAAEWWHELDVFGAITSMGGADVSMPANAFVKDVLPKLPRPPELLAAMTEEYNAAVGVTVPTQDSPSHAEGFEWVDWYGTEYTFTTPTQRAVVRRLWEDFERRGYRKAPVALATLAEALDAGPDFRIGKVFKGNSAWGTMIQEEPEAKGMYALVPP